MRRVVAALALAMIASLTMPAVGDTFVDEQYTASKPPVMGEPGWISGYYDDGIDDLRAGSVLFAFNESESVRGWETATLCNAITDAACTGFQKFEYQAYLPECSDKVVTDCIAGVTAIMGDKELTASFVRQFPERGANDFAGSSAIGLPNGESPSLWRVDGLSHAGGDQFLVAAGVTGRGSRSGLESQLRLSLYPVSVRSGMGPNFVNWHVAKLADGKVGRGAQDERVYLYRGDDEVAIRWPFPAETKFRVTVRVSKPLTGWLHGRVQRPEIDITTGSFGQQFAITAEPTFVPTVDHWTRFTALPQELKSMLIEEGRPSGAFYFGTSQDGDWEKVTTSHQNGGNTDERQMKKFLQFVQVAGDKAAANKSSWTIRTMNEGEMGSAGRCLQDKARLAGVVSTNSTVYLGGPPRFDKVSQTLDYRVASPHYSRTGTENIGQYALVMRSDVARCIYGFRDAPYSATVSVVSADGNQQVATTSVAQRDGWLYLTAAGFTYSSPTVQVKMTQEAPPEPAPIAAKPAAKKLTITCIKGKTIKKVSAVKPKCPTGYRKR